MYCGFSIKQLKIFLLSAKSLCISIYSNMLTQVKISTLCFFFQLLLVFANVKLKKKERGGKEFWALILPESSYSLEYQHEETVHSIKKNWICFLLKIWYVYYFNKYVGRLESKERLRIQPAQLFHFSWWVMWCVQ